MYFTILSGHISFSFLMLMSFFSICDQNQTYELYAVVDHFGDLRGGHYTVTIKDDERWFNFNDLWVTLVRLTTFPAVLLKATCLKC